MKAIKITHFVSKGLLTAVMLMSVNMYLFDTETVKGFFEALDFPPYLVYPLATAKILGLLVIWFGKPKWIVEWAYAGFFFNTLLALTAHLVEKDGGYKFSGLALAFTLVAYFSWKRITELKS